MDHAEVSTTQTPVRPAARQTWPVDCALLLILAAVPRFAWLGRQSLWADEVFSLRWSGLDPSFLLGAGAHLETNPPTYYLLLKGWMGVFGDGASAARSLSALAATLTVAVVYAIGRRAGGRGLAVLAGLFLALDPVMIGLGRQARGYPLLSLMCSLALLGMGEALRRDAVRRWPGVVLFTVGAIGAVLFHYTAVFFVAACFAAVAIRLLSVPALRTRGTLLLWAGSAVVTAAAIAGPLLLAAGMSRSANIAWIQPLSADTVWNFVREIVIGFVRPGLVPDVVCWVLIAVAGVGAARLRPREGLFTLAVLVPAIFLLLVVGVSLSRPLLISRTGAWLTTPLCLLFAAAVHGLTSRRLRLGGVALLLGILGGLASRIPLRPAIEDWRAVAHLIATDPRCQGPLIAEGPHLLDAFYYEPGLLGRPSYWVRLSHDQPETAEAVLQRRFSDPTALNPEQLEPFVDAHPGAALMLRFGLEKEWTRDLGDATGRMSMVHEEPGIRVYCR